MAESTKARATVSSVDTESLRQLREAWERTWDIALIASAARLPNEFVSGRARSVLKEWADAVEAAVGAAGERGSECVRETWPLIAGGARRSLADVLADDATTRWERHLANGRKIADLGEDPTREEIAAQLPLTHRLELPSTCLLEDGCAVFPDEDALDRLIAVAWSAPVDDGVDARDHSGELDDKDPRRARVDRWTVGRTSLTAGELATPHEDRGA